MLNESLTRYNYTTYILYYTIISNFQNLTCIFLWKIIYFQTAIGV